MVQRRAGVLNLWGDLNLSHLDLGHLTVGLGYLVVQIGPGLVEPWGASWGGAWGAYCGCGRAICWGGSKWGGGSY